MSCPSEVSAVLRRIASKIDRSARPDKTAVARDIRRVLASMIQAATGPFVTVTMEETTVDDAGNPVAKWRLDAEGKSLSYATRNVAGAVSVAGPDSKVTVDGKTVSARALIEACAKSPEFGLTGESHLIDASMMAELGL